MITAATSGGLGDIVYSIPTLRKLGVKRIYVKESFYYRPEISLYNSIKSLLEQNGFEVLPTSGAYPLQTYEPGLKFDYDMDQFRNIPNRKLHIILQHMIYFNISRENWYRPYLLPGGPALLEKPYTLLNLTPRWREKSLVDWGKVLDSLLGKRVYFVGFLPEYEDFKSKYGDIPYLPTTDILELAIAIRDCESLYCNLNL